MWTVSESICLLFLVIVSVRDIKMKSISVPMLMLGGVGSIIYQLISENGDILCILGGISLGGSFLLISRVTREGIGYGDSLLIMILGIYLGFFDTILVLTIAFFLLLCVSIPVLCMKKMSRKYTLPFFPFLTGGYLLFLLLGGVRS